MALPAAVGVSIIERYNDGVPSGSGGRAGAGVAHGPAESRRTADVDRARAEVQRHIRSRRQSRKRALGLKEAITTGVIDGRRVGAIAGVVLDPAASLFQGRVERAGIDAGKLLEQQCRDGGHVRRGRRDAEEVRE